MFSIRRCGVVVLVYLVLLASTTCGKDGPTKTSPPTPPPTPPPPPPVPVATRIEITPSSVTFHAIGQTQQLTATVFDQNNMNMTSASVMWSSGDAAVASVNANQGLVTAAGNGTTRVTARSGDIQANADITVAQAATRIVIEPGPAITLSIGATIQLTAAVLDRNDHPVMDAVATWSSDDAAVATVTPQGLVTAAGRRQDPGYRPIGKCIGDDPDLRTGHGYGSGTGSPDHAIQRRGRPELDEQHELVE